MAYAMVTTAIHLIRMGGLLEPKLRNLWLDAVGDRGVFVMTRRVTADCLGRVLNMSLYLYTKYAAPLQALESGLSCPDKHS